MSKVVFITGAAKGIGRALAEKFASLKYDIIINYLNSQKEAQELQKELEKKYIVKVTLLHGDISNDEDVLKMKEEIKEKYREIDILINNAAYQQDELLVNKNKQEFMRTLEVNVYGTFAITKCISDIIKNNGTILNISSTDSIDTYNELCTDYAASKAGVNILTKIFAQTFPRIKVLGIILPWIETEVVKEMDKEYLASELRRTGQNRLLTPREVAEKVNCAIIDQKNRSGDLIFIKEDYNGFREFKKRSRRENARNI